MHAPGTVLTAAALAAIVSAKMSWPNACGATKEQQFRSYGIRAVEGHWKVPIIAVAENTPWEDSFALDTWVGIDWNSICETSGGFYAGTSVEFESSPGIAHFWWRFAQGSRNVLEDFAVNYVVEIGDEVYVKTTAWDSKNGAVYFENKTRGFKRTLNVELGKMCFRSAAWVAEDPHPQGSRWPIPAVPAMIYMYGLKATTKSNQIYDLFDAKIGQMQAFGKVACYATRETSDTLCLRMADPAPI
ncbi:hypothetical protein VHEMI04259 [[Torrubiella] hemipterigena]|uniref:Uncharacterized protein n=1 Tax=[Torrubiella] hemipterigena TaxID=1531966 RepID=A0A0A1TDA7_9HYPO|nr:hypothetical protein VHEMI04259 [[Torrubiella] hemipterigena]